MDCDMVVEDKVERLQYHFSEIIKLIGEDPNREGIRRTPLRAAKSILDLTSGYKLDVETVVNNALYHSKSSGVVSVRNIEFYSICEHHLLPIIGTCDIDYIPNKTVLGLSKFARIVDMFAKRLQIQENFTIQIAQCLQNILSPNAVRVTVTAKHMCMCMRGVEKQQPDMVTRHAIGTFKTSE